jgi:hypothetical protein
MRALVACEESQVVCKAFRERGHEAYSCDLQECSGGYPEWHLKMDAIEAIGLGWDMIIAFPPCTFISNAGACRLYPTKGNIDKVRYAKGLVAKEFFLTIFAADCPKIAIENPVSSTVFNMPKHSQEIQPFHFGHPYTKKTRLWLKGLKPLIPTNIVTPTGPYIPSGTGRKDKSTYGAAKRGKDAKERSKTFPGIAKAMAEQWG